MYRCITILPLLLLAGCAAKPKRTQLALKPHTLVEFRDVNNGKCDIAAVLRDATGRYVVLCRKPEPK